MSLIICYVFLYKCDKVLELLFHFESRVRAVVCFLSYLTSFLCSWDYFCSNYTNWNLSGTLEGFELIYLTLSLRYPLKCAFSHYTLQRRWNGLPSVTQLQLVGIGFQSKLPDSECLCFFPDSLFSWSFQIKTRRV